MFLDAATSEVLFRNKREEQKAKLAELQSKPAFLSPSEQRREAYKEKLREYGITDDEALEDLAPVEKGDYVTGFHLAQDREQAIKNAQDYVEATGMTAYYVEADIVNLGGLNDYFNNNHTLVNPHYRVISDIFSNEIKKAGVVDIAKTVDVRHGGDEFGSTVIGTNKKALEKSIKTIKELTEKYVIEQGFHEIPHKKKGKEHLKGVGLYIGYSPILPGKELNHIFAQSSRMLDLSKKGKS